MITPELQRRIRNLLQRVTRVVLVSCLLASGCNGEGDGDGTSPEELLRRNTGIVLPPEAQNVFCHEEGFFVWWVHARFDLPRASLDEFVSQHESLAKISLLEGNAELRATMNTCAGELAWWELGTAGEASCGETISYREDPSPDTTWKRWWRMCVIPLDQDQDMVRVYLQFVEEASAPKEVDPE